MKKIKLSLAFITLVFGLCLITSCTSSKETNDDKGAKDEEKSIAQVLAKQFEDEIKKSQNLDDVANAIAKNEILEIKLDVAKMSKDDYISGFKTEIKDFKGAVVIRPIISSIPFIAYIFETENASEFAKDLKENADLRWNICTTADDLEVSTIDNYVFIVMAPKSFDEE